MEQDIDIGVEVPEVPELPQVQDGQKDTTDWKAIAQERQEALTKMQGMTKRFQTKLKKLAEAPKSQGDVQKQNAGQDSQNKGFDYAQKAYLKASGIAQDEFSLIEEAMKGTGMDIDGVLGSKWFQSALKEQRELKATGDATPSPTKRAGNQTRNDVDYWIAKGELPPADQPKLRQQVVNAKIAAEKAKNQFTDNAVVR